MKRQDENRRVEQGTAEGAEAPFGHLLASKPPRAGKGTAAASAASLLVHATVLGGLLYATQAMARQDVPETEEQVTVFEVPEPVVVPPPPPQAEQPPQAAADAIKGFQVLSVPDIVPTEIPPPATTNRWKAEDFTGIGVEGGYAHGRELKPGEKVEISPDEAPHFVPMTQRPRLLNQEEVVKALERAYPPLLRDVGIGGTVGVWFFIDEQGRVLRTQLQEPSEYAALNEAALQVAEVMRFAPAKNRDKVVPVWVAIPIVFSITR